MLRKKNNSIRLNIYVHDPDTRRQVKAAAARKDISVSEYCLRAITDQLVKEEEIFHEKGSSLLRTAAEKARAFHSKTFGKRVFVVSSAELIREARENRDTL
jgi:hypothetical protein